MKICILLAIAACASAFVLPSSGDIQSFIAEAQKTIEESDLSDSVKQELINLLNDPQFVNELLANNMESFTSMRTTSADPAERCLLVLALFLAQLVQSLTTTVATTVATTLAP